MNPSVTHEVLKSRSDRNIVRPDQPYAQLNEEEWLAPDNKKSISTVFITNKECPWRCVMCDLWKNTLTYSNSSDQIIKQIQYALGNLQKSNWIKLYNSGSFFDQKAINKKAWPGIIPLISSFERVIVENHPKLTVPMISKFRSQIPGEFEIAMGLETANEEILGKLNKGFDLTDFRKACTKLKEWKVKIRAFVLIQPPFTKSRADCLRDIEKACDLCNRCDVGTLSLIPTRGQTEYMKRLTEKDEFREPDLHLIDQAFQVGLNYFSGRTILDLWDLSKFSICRECYPERFIRFKEMNRYQSMRKPVICSFCEKA